MQVSVSNAARLVTCRHTLCHDADLVTLHITLAARQHLQVLRRGPHRHGRPHHFGRDLVWHECQRLSNAGWWPYTFLAPLFLISCMCMHGYVCVVCARVDVSFHTHAHMSVSMRWSVHGMCVCVCVCVCVRTNTCACNVHVNFYDLWACLCVCMYVCMLYVCMYVCMDVCMYVFSYVKSTFVCIRVFVCMRADENVTPPTRT
jgi:hypothetical protein